MAAWAFVFSLVAFAISSFQDVEADFKLGSYFSDHMVLQMQPSSAVIWGYGEADVEVQVTLSSSSTIKTVVTAKPSKEADGIWVANLEPQPAGGPHNIKIVQSSNTIEMNDVYFGDVWFCSGQSNMEFEMKKVLDAETELQKALKYDKLRFVKTPIAYDSSPREDLSPPPAPWSGPNNTTLNDFSALCWLYGEQLYDNLQVPIGLIQSSWGGTRVEAWSSPDALAKCGIKNQQSKKHFKNTNLMKSDPKDDNSVLWNAMVNPYLKIVIHGAIWYQGEANVAYNLHLYNCTFPSMINDWRTQWYEKSQGHTNLTFPFGFVQLAANANSTTMGWPYLRWHQTANVGYVPNSVMPATFMAVAMDLADDASPYSPIHPRDKKTVAVRLGYAGLNVAYTKFNFPFQGPELKSIEVDDTSALLLYDRKVKLVGQTGFKYCCKVPSSACGDDIFTTDWLPPTVSQYDDTTMYLKTTCAPSIIAYGWQERPCDYKNCPVYTNDEYGLPAPPYMWQTLENHETSKKRKPFTVHLSKLH